MRAAILGSGGMGRGVINHLLECEGIEEVMAYDLHEHQVQAVRDHPRVKKTTDLVSILRDATIPLVFVTASNDAHCELSVRSLEAGKAVMCEKPMAPTLPEARLMVDTAERLHGFLQIGFECRYSRLYSTVKEWIDEGVIGEVINTHCYYISSEFHHKGSWRNKLATGGGMFGEKLSHYVDLPRWWVGSEVQDVISTCAPNVIPYYEVRDNYHTAYRFRNGAVSHLTFMMAPGATFRGDPKQDVLEQQKDDGHYLRLLIVGKKGAAEADVFRRTLKRWEFGDSPECFTSTWVDTLTWTPKEDQIYYHNTLDQTHDIVRRVAQGLPPMTDPRDSYETMRLCFAAELSADTGRMVAMDSLEEEMELA